jgi:tRNA-dihydrouridine synthase
MSRTQVMKILNMAKLRAWLSLGEIVFAFFCLILRNGDVYSYLDFYNAIDKSGVDTSMIARGAIIKPWIFEEIQQRQHIDKSASERLDMLKQFAYWGLEHWVLFFREIYTNIRVLIHTAFPQPDASFVNS